MWGVAQIKYSNENTWSRGVVSLHTHGWVHLITYPPQGNSEEMVMMSYPQAMIEHVEWMEVRTSHFDQEGMKAVKALLDKYRAALYPAEAPAAPAEGQMPLA